MERGLGRQDSALGKRALACFHRLQVDNFRVPGAALSAMFIIESLQEDVLHPFG